MSSGQFKGTRSVHRPVGTGSGFPLHSQCVCIVQLELLSSTSCTCCCKTLVLTVLKCWSAVLCQEESFQECVDATSTLVCWSGLEKPQQTQEVSKPPKGSGLNQEPQIPVGEQRHRGKEDELHQRQVAKTDADPSSNQRAHWGQWEESQTG